MTTPKSKPKEDGNKKTARASDANPNTDNTNNIPDTQKANTNQRNPINLHFGKLKLFSWPATWKLLCVTIGLFNIPCYG